MYKTYLFIILTISSNATVQHTLCFSSTPKNTFCNKEQNNTIILEDINNTKDSIYIIQSSIRKSINNHEQVILMAEKQDATLLSIAQGNLLPYYRKHIKGLVLKEPTETSLEQMDWYWSKSVVMESNRTRKSILRKAFKKNGVEYTFVSSNASIEPDKWFTKELKCKVESKKIIKEPNYYGTISHLGFAKISYQPKNKLIHKSRNYGFNKWQGYDIFYKKNSKNNRLFIYVHGGDWVSGDKKDFFDLCKQYADRDYTAISLDYRLLELPNIGIKEMIEDVQKAIQKIVDNAQKYNGNIENMVLMADSAGAMLSYMALSKLPKIYQPKKVIFHALTSNFALLSKKKQIMLSGIEDEMNRTKWSEEFSPLSPNNLKNYTPMSLIIGDLNDKTITSKHLEELEIQSIIHNNNIHSLWIKDTLESKYQDIWLKIDKFIQ